MSRKLVYLTYKPRNELRHFFYEYLESFLGYFIEGKCRNLWIELSWGDGIAMD